VTTQYAREQKLTQLGKSSLRLSGLGSGPTLWATSKYKVTLLRTDGQDVDLVAHGLESIASMQPGCYRPQGFATSITRGSEKWTGGGFRESQSSSGPGQPSLVPCGSEEIRGNGAVQVLVRHRLDHIRQCRRTAAGRKRAGGS
jgi:hypothetical protein